MPAPEEYVEYLYRKEFGLTTYEFLQEPVDRIIAFRKIKHFENVRADYEIRRMNARSKS